MTRLAKCFAVLVLPIALTGCVDTGIQKISEDTYLLSKTDYFTQSGSVVKVEIYKEANAFCEKSGKKFVQVSNSSVDQTLQQVSGAEVQFKCQ